MPAGPTAKEVALAREIGPATAEHYAARADWEWFNYALDAYAGVFMVIGDHAEAINISQRRLAEGHASALERSDAVSMLVRSYYAQSDYGRVITTVHDALAQMRPGDHVVRLANASVWAAYAAFSTGQWPDAESFVAVVEQAREQLQDSPEAPNVALRRAALWANFLTLHIALAQEDRPRAEQATRTAEALLSTPNFKLRIQVDAVNALFTAYHEDNPAALDLRPPNSPNMFYLDVLIFPFLSERGLSAPAALLAYVRATAEREHYDPSFRYLAVAEALAAGDNALLAAAIDDAEAHELIPHAARMCIVLAQRTGDRSQLERARPVLERLGDRQFLRRLEEVQTALK